MKNLKFRWWLALCLLLTYCTPSTPSPAPAMTPTASPMPTPTRDYAQPESVGRTFLDDWTQGNYAQMYSLVAPTIRADLTEADFENAYLGALHTATTLTVTVIPETLTLEEQGAWITFSERWDTALFDTLETSNQLNLVQDNGQWWVDWQPATIWPDLADGHTFVTEYQIPPRANIYDRNGAGLAIPSTLVTVGVVPDQMEDEQLILDTLSQILDLPPEEVRKTYVDLPSNWYIPVGEITGEESLTYDENLNLPGIERRERTGRLYPLDGVGAHVVGWISPMPAEELEAYHRLGYRGDEWVGIAGLEAWGEPYLAGKNGGRLYLIDAEGNYARSVAERRPLRGRAIHTTLDRDLQHSAELVLADKPGAVVALDIHTGAVLALTSGPGFDNNIFIRGTDEDARRAILSDPQQPLFNRAIQGLYPCGSVFKIITMAAGLEAGNLKGDSYFVCPGYWDGLGEENRKTCWLETGHGEISLQDGLTASCNVVYYEVGRILDREGQDVLPTFSRAFGLGPATGLTGLYESDGLVPDPEWKQDTYYESWGLGDTVNLAIGQGFLLVTPLQIARMIAAVANGGTLYRPYVIGRIDANSMYPEQTTQPEAWGQLPVSETNLKLIQDAMLAVTTEPLGTATRRFTGLDIPVAGKTGTAQTLEDAESHSWFAGYFPADDPQIAMVVIAEFAGEGPTVAAPMFRQVMEHYYGLPITPLPDPEALPPGD